MHARIAGHPLHPALVHFPLALWLSALLWDALGWWQGDALWWQLSYWTLALGLVAALPALITGFIEYVGLDPEHRGFDVATTHMMLMLAAAVIFGTSWVSRAQASPSTAPATWALWLMPVGAIVLAVGGWFGGTLVYRYGVGRENADFNAKTG